MTDRNYLQAAPDEIKMYNSQTSATVPGRPKGFEPAIGQIDLLDAQGEPLRTWRIQTSKCTIGSSVDCTIQLDPAEAAPLHATLIFGKRHTLLRALAPTKIANRNVREWLIDHPTEVLLGNSRIVVHPSIGIMATVVQAEQLLDRAAKLCSDPAPIIQVVPRKRNVSNVATTEIEPIDSTISATERAVATLETNSTAPNELAPSALSTNETIERFERIEQLLLSLQSALDRVQDTMKTEPKESEENLSSTVADHFESFGKNLFSSLSDQFMSHSERHESLISNFSEQVILQFATIDQQLQYVAESNSQQTIQLSELIEHAVAEQSFIQTRFAEVAANRDELMNALQVLHGEIANAHYSYANAYKPIDQSQSATEQTASYVESDPQYGESDLSGQTTTTPATIRDQQLAESLEKAQSQIQEYNQQLRELEAERQIAEQKIVALANSLAIYSSRALQTNLESPSLEGSVVPTNDSSEHFYDEVPSYHDELPSEKPQLPAWFTNSELVSHELDDQTEDPVSHNALEAANLNDYFSQPDLSQYSELLNERQESSYQGDMSAGQDMVPGETSYVPETNSGSISERLQRMLVDADARRGSNSGPLSTSSRRWSQTYAANPSSAVEGSEYETHDQDGEPEQEREQEVFFNQQDSLGNIATDQAFSAPEVSYESYVDADNQKTSEPVEAQDAYSSTDRNELANFGMHQKDHLDERPSVNQSAIRSESPSASKGDSEDETQEESIEAYMNRLLQRVRTGSDAESISSQSPRTSASASNNASSSKSRVAASLGLDVEKASPSPENLVPLTQESFVPRQQAPEQRNDLTALRELANSNARRAISRSDTERTNTAFYFKMIVTAVAVSSAVALLMLNGLRLNMPFAGMVAAVVVSFLWGYDCLNHFKRLQDEAKLAPASNSQSPAMNSIQVGPNDDAEEHWRPTPA